ncbi:beta-ketoacyl-[acyl-carrier-protein] synthase family protein [Microbacterium sp. H83]|uniref:beta-ketoacyl-[acyl-carrier-protein] synthase family protein n=1 Tax=Microbacterium sp. H83 TaxID=1827324 RepID=UPI0007F4E35F|nr:beta-ketoacyl-[acyl-carrier-protein] synthase family protein [Microbacterium sp. H83]OAN40239.1 beta-ketoacyl-[acyl-carrier-protein] synthase II [Microbacterium sp. H83]
MTKRIVVTGIGATSAIGGTAPENWANLLAGMSGTRTLEHDWVQQYELPVTFAAEAIVRPEEVLPRHEAKRLDPSSQFALIAAREAWADAGSPEVAPERLGVDFATGIGGLWTLLDAWDTLREKGPRRVMPLTVPMLMPNAAAGNLSLQFEARAYAQTVVSACASSTESVIHAFHHLQEGLADVVIAGGTESAIHPITMASFASAQALSRRNDDPATASRPGAIDRDGFVMGEGAAALILETEEHAKARGAKIYGYVLGGGVTADAYHITGNDPEGNGAARAVTQALAEAGISADQVTHINAHATSTPVGDPNEYVALKKVFGDRIDEIPVSATKASTGHLLGGTGALEAIFSLLALRDRVAPPTINMTEPDPAVPFRLSGEPTPLGEGPQIAISNSFGFGGHNAVAVFASAD